MWTHVGLPWSPALDEYWGEAVDLGFSIEVFCKSLGPMLKLTGLPMT